MMLQLAAYYLVDFFETLRYTQYVCYVSYTVQYLTGYTPCALAL